MQKLFVYLVSYFRTIFPKKHQTIRYTFSLLFLLATVAGFASVILSNGHTVRLEATSRVTTGETFEINVYANAKSAVNAVNVQILLPEQQFQLLGVNRGESVLTLWTSDPHIKSGVVYLEGGTYRKGFIGEHKIATLLVRSLVEGKNTVRVKEASFYAGDGSGLEFKVGGLGGVDLIAYAPDTEKTDLVHYAKLADLNNDGKITFTDISIFMSFWNSKDRIIDFDNDGKMTFTDFSIMLSIYFKQNR